jgi:2-dehydropantoate 2-reductase
LPARVAVVGCGAVGSTVAAALAGGGLEVYCVSRRLRGCGRARVEVEEFASAEVTVCGWESVRGLAVDAVVYAVKAYDMGEALAYAKRYGLRGRLHVSLQNGLGSLESLEALARGRAAGGVVFFGAVRLQSWCCRAVLLGRGPVLLGPRRAAGLEGDAWRLLEELAEAMRAGGLEVEVVGDIEPYRWLKLAVNAAINPVTVLAWAPNRVVLEDGDARELAFKLAAEAARVAEAWGVELPEDPLGAVERTARLTGDNCSSMLQDVAWRGRSEVDYINGAVAGRARVKGLEAPYNTAVWRAVRLLQRWLRGRGLPCELSLRRSVGERGL